MQRILVFIFALAVTAPAEGATKIFSGAGDGTAWHDDQNWSAAGVPANVDAVTIDTADAAVTAKKDFAAQSVTVGGKATATWTVDSSVYGTIAPTTTSDPAILIRKDGTVILKGTNGTVTVKGPFKNSEESLPSEPSVMILLQ